MSTIFLLLAIYQLKHFLADYPLQGRYMLGKFKPGWDFLGPLAAHAGVHGAMTFAITFAFTGSVAWGIHLALFDAGIHFAMDRIKASPKYMGRWKPLTAAEYRAAAEEDANGGLLAHEARTPAKRKLRGNTLFWWALGFDQMLHHLTHYACVYLILRHLP